MLNWEVKVRGDTCWKAGGCRNAAATFYVDGHELGKVCQLHFDMYPIPDDVKVIALMKLKYRRLEEEIKDATG